MRKLDDEERAALTLLDSGPSTPELIAMVRDLGTVLRGRGHVVQANVAELAADRLARLDDWLTGKALDRPGAVALPNVGEEPVDPCSEGVAGTARRIS